MKSIHISKENDDFVIDMGESVFLAKSIMIEPAPSQPGKVIWMYSVVIDADSVKPADGRYYNDDGSLKRKEIVGTYIGPNGEEPDEKLIGYLIAKNEHLRMN